MELRSLLTSVNPHANQRGPSGCGRWWSTSERQPLFTQALHLLSSEGLTCWGSGVFQWMAGTPHTSGRMALHFRGVLCSKPHLSELRPPWHLWCSICSTNAAPLSLSGGRGGPGLLMGLWHSLDLAGRRMQIASTAKPCAGLTEPLDLPKPRNVGLFLFPHFLFL